MFESSLDVTSYAIIGPCLDLLSLLLSTIKAIPRLGTKTARPMVFRPRRSNPEASKSFVIDTMSLYIDASIIGAILLPRTKHNIVE